jgi:hypothetical protein
VNFLRRHLTYANVVASLALFLALGGAAFAATQLPRNSVGTGQLKPEAVTAGKIAKKTRQQLQGARGPAGAQGPQGKTGAKGAAGAKGATGATGGKGAAGTDGTGPALEVFASSKPLGAASGSIAAENLPAGFYAISANAVIESATASVITCTLNGSGTATGFVEAGVPATLSLSEVRNLGGGGTAVLSCSGTTGGTVTYANVIATQVKSASRFQG